MAQHHISNIAKSLESCEWLNDDWVKQTIGKKQNKRARQLVATHNARNFAVVNAGHGWRRALCSSVAQDEEFRYLAQASISNAEITDISCECGKKGTDEHKCDHIAALLVTLALFKQGMRKIPHWMKHKTEEPVDINNLTDEQKAIGIGLPYPLRLYALTLAPESELPYETDENGAPEPVDAIPSPFSGDMKSRRKRSVYSMNRKRALLRAAAPPDQFGRWALEHFTPDLLAKLLEERPTTMLTKIASLITEDEMVAFECGMQDEVPDFDDRVDQIERDVLAQMKSKKLTKAQEEAGDTPDDHEHAAE